MQREGDRYFVRDRRGWFSMMFPCKPALSRLPSGTDRIKLIMATCQLDGSSYSMAFGRFKPPTGAVSPSVDQIYDFAARGLDSSAMRSSPASGKLQLAEATIAGRSARYFSYLAADGSGVSAHVWILWAEEQQAIYQVVVTGKNNLADAQRMVRSMLVPSP